MYLPNNLQKFDFEMATYNFHFHQCISLLMIRFQKKCCLGLLIIENSILR